MSRPTKKPMFREWTRREIWGDIYNDCTRHRPSPWTGVERRFCDYPFGRDNRDFCRDCHIKFVEEMALPAVLSKELYYRLGKR